MNRKTLVSIIFVAVIFVVGLGAVIITDIVNAYHPVKMNISAAQLTTVSGNGGNAVIVGDYVYFVGNYVNTGDIKYKQNEYNKVKFGAIYRVKLTGAVPTYSDADMIETVPDYVQHHINDMQLIVPKIAGYDKSSLYVFGKYLIYTSPNNTKDKYGVLQTSKTDFFRVNLDGSDNKLVYTTSSDSVAKTDYTVACYGSSIYLLIKDGSNLNRVNVTGSAGKVDRISSAVTSFVLPIVSAYSGDGDKSLASSYGGVMNFVYYTEDLSQEDKDANLTGNILKQYRVTKGNGGGGNTEVVPHGNGTQFTVLALSGGRLLYSVIEDVSKLSGAQPHLYMTKDDSDANSTDPFSSQKRGNYLVLNGTEWSSSEQFSMPTERSFGTTDIIFLSQAANPAGGNFIYIYAKAAADTSAATLKKQVANVDSIIAITSSTAFYKSTGGEIMSVSLYGNDVPVGTGLTPDSLSDMSFFSQSGIGRIFYIKSFSGVSNTDASETNCAMMIDLATGKEYILGNLSDDYFQTVPGA